MQLALISFSTEFDITCNVLLVSLKKKILSTELESHLAGSCDSQNAKTPKREPDIPSLPFFTVLLTMKCFFSQISITCHYPAALLGLDIGVDNRFD